MSNPFVKQTTKKPMVDFCAYLAVPVVGYRNLAVHEAG